MTSADPADESPSRRHAAGLVVVPLLFLLVLLAPLPLTAPAQRLAAVAALVMTFWVTEAVPLAAAALLVPTLATLLGVAKAKDALAPFGDPVIFLFLGSFLLAEALRVHGLDRRIALGILDLPGAARSPGRVRLAIAGVTAVISMWISNTATAAMMLPIALGLVRALSAAGSPEPPRATLLLVGMAASLGGVGTPVGTPPNLIALGFLRQAGMEIEFPRFMMIGVPLAAAMVLCAFAIVWRMLPPPAQTADVATFVAAERARMEPWGAGQTACATAFAVAIVLWLLPGLATAVGVKAGWTSVLEEAIVALLAAALLFVWPVGGGRRALSWADAARIDWGTLMLFGGGLSLGKLMFDTGLANTVGRGILAATHVESLWALTALVLALTILLTETASNTATVSMLAPLTIALCQEMGVPVAPPLLAVAFGASMGFMFPVGTPPNAIVYGTGLVPLASMMRVGIVVDVLSFFVILGILRALCPMLGLA